jgi:electron transfer flavoprotein alpha subunit
MLGISGEVTAPEACLLLGVSGTPAFLYGISGAKHVVAVNTDPDAAVFSRAEAGTQADWKVICAALEGALDK